MTVVLFVQGFKHFGGDVVGSLQQIGQDYAAAFNRESNLYFDFFSVFVSGFVITFALMLQPHILTKVLYLRSEKDVTRFIATTVVVGAVFMLMLMIGFYAVIAKPNLIKKLIGLTLFQAAVFLLYITMGKLEGGTAPIFSKTAEVAIFSSPLPQVLILTAIVVGISTTALGLAIVVRIREEYGTIEEDEIAEIDRR